MKKNLIYSGMIAATIMFAVGKTNAQTDWHIVGNAGTTPGTNFMGTTDNKAVYFKTTNFSKLLSTTVFLPFKSFPVTFTL